MTIESSHKPGVAKHSAAGSNHSWGKTAAGGKSSPDATGGFGSILAALDPAVGGEVDFGPSGAKTSKDVLLGSMASAPVPGPGLLPLGGELESIGGGDHSPISNVVSESLVPEKVSVADPTSLALLVDPSSQTPAGNLIAAELIELNFTTCSCESVYGNSRLHCFASYAKAGSYGQAVGNCRRIARKGRAQDACAARRVCGKHRHNERAIS